MNGGTTASCSAALQLVPPTNGACGSANGFSKFAPSQNLCNSGAASNISGSGPWSWTCNGANGGVTAFCSAVGQAQNPIYGACGGANGVHTNTMPTTNLCASGTPTTVSGSGPYAWYCSGSFGGGDAACSTP